MSDQSTLWGAALEYWDKRGVVLMIIGGAFGFAALGATVASSFILWKVAGVAQSDLETKTRDHDKELGEQKKETEELRAKNLAFEAALAPRTVEQRVAGIRLKQFADISVVVLSAPNSAEARRTAGQIRWLLRQEAGWPKFSGQTSDPSIARGVIFRDGISIRAEVGPNAMRVIAAATELSNVLKESGIESMFFPTFGIGTQAIIVQVGLKPMPPSLKPSAENMPSDSSGGKAWGNILEE